jgi:hypothetical protein
MRWRSCSSSRPIWLLLISSLINALISLMASAIAAGPIDVHGIRGCSHNIYTKMHAYLLGWHESH